MKRKWGVVFNIATLCLCLFTIAFGVYSAKHATMEVGGTVGFEAHDCKVNVSGVMNAYEQKTATSTKKVTKYFNSTSASGGSALTVDSVNNNSWNIGNVVFDDLHATTSKPVNDIEFEFVIENASDYYVDVTVNQDLINSDRIFIYAPNNGETLAPQSATSGKSVTLIVKIQLQKDSSGKYSSLSSAITLDENTPLLNFTKSTNPAYLATDWKTAIADGFGISTASTTTDITSIEFASEMPTDTSIYNKNADNTLKGVSVASLNETSAVSTYDGTTSDVTAYYSTSSKKLLIYSPARIYAPQNCKTMFRYPNVTTITFNNFDTSKTTNMMGLLYECSALTSVNLSNFDTSNVTNMYGVFLSCGELTTIDLHNFDTSNVEDMTGMFAECNKLESVDWTNFNTSNVTTMLGMFQNCYKLTSVDLSSWDLGNVTDTQYMFNYCTGLQSVNMSGCKFSKLTDALQMFANCTLLTNINLTGCNFSELTNAKYMFGGTNLENIDLSDVDFIKLENAHGMFLECSSLKSIDLSDADFTNCTDTSYMFNSCTSLTTIKYPKNIKYLGYCMFQNSQALSTITIPDTVVWIGNFAFNHCGETTPVNQIITIPASVKQIGGKEYVGNNNENEVIGSHVFYSARNYITKFVVESGNTNFVTDSAGALYTKDYKYLISYPSATTATSFEIHEGCEKLFELSFGRVSALKEITISDSLIIQKYLTDGFLNISNSLSCALYTYASVTTFKVKSTNTNYVAENGILYAPIDGDKNNLELIAIPTSYAYRASGDNVAITISEKCIKIDGIALLCTASRAPTKFIVKTGTTIVDAVEGTHSGYTTIVSGSGVVENGTQYIYAGDDKVLVEFV